MKNGRSGNSNFPRHSSIIVVSSLSYSSAFGALDSPWYQSTPLMFNGTSGAIIALYRLAGLMPNIESRKSVGLYDLASVGPEIQPSTHVPPNELSIRPIGTSFIAGLFRSASAKKNATAEMFAAASREHCVHFAFI